MSKNDKSEMFSELSPSAKAAWASWGDERATAPAPTEEKRFLGGHHIPTTHIVTTPQIACLPDGSRVALPKDTVIRDATPEDEPLVMAGKAELETERAAKWNARKLWQDAVDNRDALGSILHEISDALGHARGAVPGTPFAKLPELVRAALERNPDEVADEKLHDAQARARVADMAAKAARDVSRSWADRARAAEGRAADLAGAVGDALRSAGVLTVQALEDAAEKVRPSWDGTDAEDVQAGGPTPKPSDLVQRLTDMARDRGLDVVVIPRSSSSGWETVVRVVGGPDQGIHALRRDLAGPCGARGALVVDGRHSKLHDVTAGDPEPQQASADPDATSDTFEPQEGQKDDPVLMACAAARLTKAQVIAVLQEERKQLMRALVEALERSMSPVVRCPVKTPLGVCDAPMPCSGHDVTPGKSVYRPRLFVAVLATTEISGEERLLLVKHRDRGWELPGGHVLPGEDWRTAALRELHEETGLKALEVLPTVTVFSSPDALCVVARAYVEGKPKPGGDAIDAELFRHGRLQGLALSDLPTADLVRMWEKGAPS